MPRIQATEFECKHQTLLHLLPVGLASLSYLIDPVDVVWAVVRNHIDSQQWERLVFGFGALMLLISATLETWVNAFQAPLCADNVQPTVRSHAHLERLARILLVLTIGLLLPLPGTILLLIGETILMLRLRPRKDSAINLSIRLPGTQIHWRSGFRVAASRWGFAASMIAFVWTLQDRVAEIGAACSAALWVLVNLRRPR